MFGNLRITEFFKRITPLYILTGIVFAAGLLPVFIDWRLVYPLIVPKTLLFFGLIIISLVILLFHFLFRKGVHLFTWRCTPSLISLCAFLLIGFLATIASINPTISFWGTLERMSGFSTILFFSLFALILYFAKDFSIYKAFFLGTILSGVYIAGYLFINIGFSRFSNELLIMQNGGPLGNTTFAGSFLLFAAFFALFFSYREKNRVERLLHSIFFVFILICPVFLNYDVLLGRVDFQSIVADPLLLLGSAQTATLALWLGLCIFFIHQRVRTRVLRRGLLVSIYSIICVSVFLLYIPGSPVQNAVEHSASSSRFLFWHIAEEGITERPLLGYGFENYIQSFYTHFDARSYLPEFKSEIAVDRPHNYFLEMWYSTGTLGFLAYIGFWFFALYGLWVNRTVNEERRLVYTIFFPLLIVYHLQNMMAFDMPTSLAVAMVTLSFVNYVSPFKQIDFSLKKNLVTTIHRFRHSIFVGACACGIVATLYMVVLPYYKDFIFEDIVLGTGNTSFTDRVTKLAAIQFLHPLGAGRDIPNILSIIRHSTNLSVASDPKISPEDKQQLALICAQTRNVYKDNLIVDPIRLPSLLEVTQYDWCLYQLTKIPSYKDEALTYFDRAEELSPQYLDTYWQKAEFFHTIGDDVVAKEVLAKASRIAPYVPDTQGLYDSLFPSKK